MTLDDTAETIAALANLAEALQATGLRLDLDEAGGARATRDELHQQITDYLIPRLRRIDAPLLAVIGGSTGSGKSTITNSIVGTEVSVAGVLRPTTRAPVLVCHPDDLEWFARGEILADLPRVGTTVDDNADDNADIVGARTLKTVTVESLTPGVAILDAPDIDSVEVANRALATQLLAAADLWLFTTTAVRYADAVPWEFLHQAQSRGTAMAVVINRIPPGAEAEIVDHFEAMASAAGLSAITVFPLPQSELVDGRLPATAVGGIVSLLTTIARDSEQRAQIVAQTLSGTMGSIESRVVSVTMAATTQREVTNELGDTLEANYQQARSSFEADISNGNLLRDEVLDRWQELVGTAELMRAVQSRITRARDRLTGFITGRTSAARMVQGEITSTLEQLLVDHADAAAEATVTAWRHLPGGRQVLADDRSFSRSSPDLAGGVGAEIRAWQGDVLALVGERGAGKRTTARVLALGVNSIGVALMIMLFAQTGGVTGAEIAVGAGTAGVSQTLLSALFGEQAVRELALEARRLLLERISGLFDADAERFRSRLGSEVGSLDSIDDLRLALARFERSR